MSLFEITSYHMKGFSFIFLKILEAFLSITKVRIFLIALSIVFSNSKILGFLFLQGK